MLSVQDVLNRDVKSVRQFFLLKSLPPIQCTSLVIFSMYNVLSYVARFVYKAVFCNCWSLSTLSYYEK